MLDRTNREEEEGSVREEDKGEWKRESLKKRGRGLKYMYKRKKDRIALE